MFKLIIMIMAHLVFVEVAYGQPVVDEYGNIQQICVKFKQDKQIVWYKGSLFTTIHERENDLATVVISDPLGIEIDQFTRNSIENECSHYRYDRGSYTVVTNIDGKLNKFHGVSSFKPWVEVN